MFLLEAAFDDEAAGAVDGACCAHFGEEELDDVFWLFFWRVGSVGRGKGEKGMKKERRTCLCIFLHISVTFAKMDFLFPSRKSWGGAMVYRFREDVERRAGLAACREA